MSEALSPYATEERTATWFSVFLYDAPGEQKLPGRRIHFVFRNNLLVIETTDMASLGRAFIDQMEALRFKERDDALYLEAAIVSSDGVSALMPSGAMYWVASLGRAVKRMGLSLPASQYSAIDVNTGQVVPVRQMVISEEAVDRFERLFPSTEKRDRAVIDGPLAVDMVISPGAAEDPVVPVSRATGLAELAGGAMNLPKLKLAGLTGLARLVERAACYQVPAGRPDHMAESLARTMTLKL